MRNTLLVVDTQNLAYRAVHAQKGVYNPDGEHIGVLFGIMQECMNLEARFETKHFAFCFDSKHHEIRRAIHPGYKGARAERRELEDEEAKALRQEMYRQVNMLPGLLKQTGCVNIFGAKNYEADDCAASIVQNLSPYWDRVVLCSSDEDLYQLLEGDKVVQYKPVSKKMYTEAMLMEEYSLQPCQWASCKSWAGDDGDSVPGIKGVGLKTSAKWLLGKASDKQKALFEANIELYNRNIRLVKLPLPGCPRLFAEPQLEPMDWEIVAEKIGLPTRPPRGIRV